MAQKSSKSRYYVTKFKTMDTNNEYHVKYKLPAKFERNDILVAQAYIRPQLPARLSGGLITEPTEDFPKDVKTLTIKAMKVLFEMRTVNEVVEEKEEDSD